MAIIKIDGTITTSHSSVNDITDLTTTSSIAEGSNLYFTEARVNTNFASKTTTDLTEGSNLYFTDQRAIDAVGIPETIVAVNQELILENQWNSKYQLKRNTGDGYDVTTNIINFSDSGANQINHLDFRTENMNKFFAVDVTGIADDGTHESYFVLTGEDNTFESKKSNGDRATLRFKANDFRINADNISYIQSDVEIALTTPDIRLEATTQVKLDTPVVMINNKYQLPNSTGSAGQVMVTDGTAQNELTWSDNNIDTMPHVFVNLNTTERNALTATPGMIIFNTTDSKIQAYDGTTWNNLH